jgi:hypothetical protein
MRHINYPSLPPLPKALEQEILDIAKQTETFQINNIHVDTSKELLSIIGCIDYDPNTNLGYHHSEAKKYFPTMSNYYFLDVSNTIRTWVHENIDPKYNAHIQVISNGTLVPPHVDEVRSSAINYLIETGGDGITSFYCVNSAYTNLTITPQTSIPYERLTVIENTIIESNTWHRLDVTQIHGVTSMDSTQKRIALTLSIV